MCLEALKTEADTETESSLSHHAIVSKRRALCEEEKTKGTEEASEAPPKIISEEKVIT